MERKYEQASGLDMHGLLFSIFINISNIDDFAVTE
jgi:hypothetical protein